VIEGVLGVEEAEALCGLLLDAPEASIDLGACEHVHAAVAQVLRAAARSVRRAPADKLLADVLKTCPGRAVLVSEAPFPSDTP